MKFLKVSLALLVFLSSCWIGISIARQKPLWWDEIYSEEHDIGASGYWDIIAGTGTSGDGQKSAIYFCFQKFIDQAFSYKLPAAAVKPDLYVDKTAQVVCRISAIIWMSLSIALIFYYFTCSTALWAGVIAWLITLSTFMVWGYWAEDRPYAFWFFLTSIQSLVILWSSQYKHKRSFVLGSLMLINILLSLTMTTSLVQIAAVSVWMFCVGYRKMTDYIVTTVIPAGVCLYYYSQSPHYSFVFVVSAWQMIMANIPLERIVLLFAAALYLWKRSFSAQDRKDDLNYLLYSGLIFTAGIGLLLAFKMKEGANGGYKAGAKYLIFLAPVGIIALTFVFTRLMQMNRSLMVRVALVLSLVLLTVPRIWKYAHFSYSTGEPKYLGSSFKGRLS